MIYTPVVDNDVVLADFAPQFESFNDRVEAAFAALVELGNDVEVTEENAEMARQLFQGEQQPVPKTLADSGTILHLKAILSEYDKQVVESAAQMRIYVTNKLLEESTNHNPSIRIKALELLGKISDVGLFSEKTEITLRHRPTAELEQMLKERLERVIGGSDISDAKNASPQPQPLDLAVFD